MSSVMDEINAQIAMIQKAFEESAARGKGLLVGKLFRTQVADGYAVYQVVKINKSSVKVKWRKDLALDGWQDQTLGAGGTFPKRCVEQPILREEALAEIFSRKREK
jgi:hypothetical protein